MYVVAGYPPFLKMLVDNRTIDWGKYDAISFYGGEGMSESMRDYLMQVFRGVYGDYGASDLEINIGAENDFTVALRRLMQCNEKLRHRLNQRQTRFAGCEHLEDALPHIFQYNSLDYLIEVGEAGELLVTLCRASNVAPKIRYNIHDSGFVMSYKELLQILRDENIDVAALPPVLANLPLMFHYGRSDDAVPYYGCKIPPSAIAKIIFEIPELAGIYKSFRLLAPEDDRHNKHLTLAIELAKDVELPADPDRFGDAVFQALANDSQDYRESSRIALQNDITPKLEFHRFGEGPFVGSDIRLKNRYKDEK
jgi:phenylacetate-CoA ligase